MEIAGKAEESTTSIVKKELFAIEAGASVYTLSKQSHKYTPHLIEKVSLTFRNDENSYSYF